MNLSMKWLADYTDVSDVTIKEYCDRMTMSGSKVEGWEELGGDISGVVCGRILKIDRHPNADKLVVCQVDVGAENPVQIITAATNVFEGATVPVALHGAHLPGDVKITKGKLRGEVSEGMFCSIAELGLTTHDMPGAIEDGILILDHVGLSDIPLGEDMVKALGLRDVVVEFEITSNRPDCLSVLGLARESAVTFGKPLTLPPVKKPSPCPDGDSIENYLSVDVQNTEKCYRYSARVVKNVKIGPSPLWLRMKLRSSGVRPINNIVDITNFVMLEYGQPMHAFDYKCLDGSKIVVRSAKEGEEFVSLDSVPHTLENSMLVIADEKKPVALAGVMGGENSEITDDTTTVVFESATFHPGSVRVAAKKLGMRTESSSRFEKGLDSENTMPALDRACEMVELLCAGEVVNGTIDVYPTPKQPVTLPLDADVINSFLGVNLTQEYMAETMKKLEFGVSDDLKTITVPSFRDDVRCMNDVAEEILRMYGYDKITSTLSQKARPTLGARTERQNFDNTVHDMLIGMGLDEIATFSFISPSWYDKIRLSPDDPRRTCVVISNPLGEDTSVMRTTTLPSMLKVLSDNYNMKNRDFKLFEQSRVYLPGDPAVLPEEPARLTLGFHTEKNDSFYKVKGYIEAILAVAGIEGAVFRSVSDEPTFHPGRCAEVYVNGNRIGIFGEAHPAVRENYGIEGGVYLAELSEDALYENRRPAIEYTAIPKHPAVERDFSFVCGEEVEAASVASVIKESTPLVASARLFDIFRGPQIGADKKSMSYAVMLRAQDRTLTDTEADEATEKILAALADKLNIRLR
ncbi:MAG: phenylalanine--tRNA ligase subunit beta [Ruminococcaceae bacterium]|nr:phenylalanine--tRNA ligase subunit beta [Oscillospiraceae bacterium]